MDVRLWRDKWVKGVEGNLAQFTEVPEEKKAWKVADVIRGGRWAISRLEGLVPNGVLVCIENMALDYMNRRDKPVWMEARDRDYSVKKGYYCVRRQLRKVCGKPSTSVIVPKGVWRQISNLQLLPKIKLFIWRCFVQVVPVKDILARRRCSLSIVCPVCEAEPETLEHAIFFYSWTRYVWFGCNLALKLETTDMRSFSDWWLKMLFERKVFNEFQLAYFAWVVWLIWKERNSVVFYYKRPNPWRVVNMAGIAIDEYWKAMGWYKEEGVGNEGNKVVKGWTKPGEGLLKINCDGSFNKEGAAVGVVCRDEDGRFIWGFGEKVKAESAAVAEILALKKAVSLIEEARKLY